jgi:sugar O-acyltransferase (sialic acid O-acetyltransferase NeuD family)
MKPVVIFGCGEIAELAHFYFTHEKCLDVRGFTVDPEYVKSDSFLGLPLVPFMESAVRFPPAECEMFVAVSYAQLNRLRAERCAAAKALGYRLATYVSSKATVWPGFTSGENCFILEDNTIQPFVQIGNNVTMWSGNHVGHHSSIGDNCFITSHAVISGGVAIGPNCFLGVNCTIRDHVSIGPFSVIGAGALVTADVPAHGVIAPSGTDLSRVPSNRLRKL